MRPPFLLLTGVLLFGAGCTEIPVYPPQPPPPPPPPSGPLELVKINAGDGQADLEGTQLWQRFEVIVRRGDVPQAGVLVTWETSSGSLSSLAGHTGYTGLAHSRLTLGTQPGEVTIVARIADQPDVAPVVFHATVWERLIAMAEPTTNHQMGEVGTTLASPLRVRVTKDGAPRAGIPVTWAVSMGAITPPTATTDAHGMAEATWTLGTTPGAPVAVAVIRGAPAPVQFFATAAVAPPALITLFDVFGVPANHYEVTISAVLRDQFGNESSGAALEWSIEGPGAIRWSDDVTGPDGFASAGIDPSGVPGEIRVRLRAVASDSIASGSIHVTPPSYDIKVFALWEGQEGFWSPRNWTHPAIDTVPAGATVRWYLVPDDFGAFPGLHSVESVGTPSFVGGPVLDGADLQVVFTASGVYLYRDLHTGATGTLVVVE